MSHLGKIDIAFLPKNLPYTMSDAQFIEAAKRIHPKYLYPYHYFSIDREALRKALPKEIILK
jgi:L-ascorbate metabolism protein UlaG (beta-lactamase superfamily)